MPRSDDPRPPSTFARAFRRQDPFAVRPLGVSRMASADVYHRLMRMSWPNLSALFAACFFAFNLAFAMLYWLDPSGLSAPADRSGIAPFWRDFFFSVHTVATIGYGNVYPVSTYANVMVVIEITLGIMFFALATGIAFARFSRPTARILFSEVLVIRTVAGVPTLMLRAANQRHNLIFSAGVRVSLLDDEELGGTIMRRFVDLKLVRDSNPAFALTWTIMHPIGADSPLRSWLEASGPSATGEIIVVLSGIDESSGQMIHGRWAYGADDIRWNARFVDIVGTDGSGTRTIDYTRFHAIEAEQALRPVGAGTVRQRG